MKSSMKFVLAIFLIAFYACNAQEQQLPKELKFDISYKPWYITGEPHEPVEYIFKIHLAGQADAMKNVRSVNYELSKQASGARITNSIQSSFYVEGAIPAKDSTVIIAIVRMKNGKKLTHKIPLRPH